MNPEATLSYEARVRNRQVAMAALAGILLIAAAAIQLSGPHTKVDELTVDLITANQRFPLDLIASVVNAVASLAIAGTLSHLMVSVRNRNSEIKPYIRILAIVGGVVAAITGIVYAIVVALKVHQFVTTGAQTYSEANHLTSAPGLLVLQLLGQLGALILAVAFVLVALNAMRVGLLSKFMGYLGIFAGVLTLFQITQIPVVQGYWLAAVAYLLSGRWPTGMPPAWTTGRAEAWPSSAELRARRAAGAGAKPTAKPVATPEPQTAGGPAAGRTRATTSKRKRKRRS
ncbi:MAG: hypothetical protein ABI323_10030 [Solirubrobacteraceae bacterium]